MVESKSEFRVVGLLSGTSVDGIDVAVAAFHADEDELTLTPLGYRELDYPEQLRRDILAARLVNLQAGQLPRVK